MHQLFVDEHDNLYLENEETQLGNGWVSLIKVAPNGEESYVIEPTKNNELLGSKFALDKDGNLYYQHIYTKEDDVYVYIYKREPGGKYYPYIGGLRGSDDGYRLEARFTKIETMTLLNDGNIYVTDNGAIRRITTDGQVTTIAGDLLENNPPDNPWGGNNYNTMYDLDMDENGNFYVAYYSNARVLKVTPDGKHSDFYYSGGEWFPLGIAYYDGAIFVFETAHGSGRGAEEFRMVKLSLAGESSLLIESGKIINSIKNAKKESTGYRLQQNYPNPFNSSTKISFSLPARQHVSLDIYSINSKHITTLINETKNAGNHTLLWNGTDGGNPLPSGVYFSRFSAGLFSDVQKILYLK